MGKEQTATTGEQPAGDSRAKHMVRAAIIGGLLTPFVFSFVQTRNADSHASLGSAALPEVTAPSIATNADPAEKVCTTIRRRPEEIMFGTACSDEAQATVIDSGFGDKGWAYSAVLVDGIYKCGYVRTVLPELTQPRRGVIDHCRKHYPALTKERHSLFGRINCPEVLPGVEGCRDGTHGAELDENCGNPNLYGNYASDEPSPLNVYGTGNGGFSMWLGEITDLIHFRAEINITSQQGSAAVLRAHEWGMVARHCVDNDYLDGGTISRLTDGQLENINANDQHRAALDWIKQANAAR
jgi:hypothetical protein